VERTTGEVLGADQRLSRPEALRLYTSAAAHVTFDERRKGRLAPGLLADLVVLADDPLTCPDAALADLPVELTMVGGRVVHAAPGLGG
jgi:predicted amidohydrolase YtcJ